MPVEQVIVDFALTCLPDIGLIVEVKVVLNESLGLATIGIDSVPKGFS